MPDSERSITVPLTGEEGEKIHSGVREIFKAEAAAADMIRVVLARKPLFQTLFFSIRNAWEEASALIDYRQEHYPRPPDDMCDLSDEERRLHGEVASHMALYADAANALVMLLDAPLRNLGIECGSDQRRLGAEAYNGVKFAEAIWALGNRHRHVHGWMSAKASALAKNPSVMILRKLGVDPVGFDAAYQVIKKCSFTSYHDFENRVLSIPRDLLNSPLVEVDAQAHGWSMTIKVANDSSANRDEGTH